MQAAFNNVFGQGMWTIVGSIIAFLIGLVWIRGDDPHVQLIALGFLPVLVMAVFPLLRGFMLIPVSPLTRYGITMGAAFEMPILFYALTSDVLPLSQLDTRDADASLFRRIGILAPLTRPEIGEVKAGGAGERAGLRQGDLVRRIDGQDIVDGQQLRERIRAGVRDGKPVEQKWLVERDGASRELVVTPEVHADGKSEVGRINAFVGAPPATDTGPTNRHWPHYASYPTV